MRTPHLLTLASALVILFAGPTAWAARPLVSETADSLAQGDCEFESALASTRVRGRANTGSLDALVACGFHPGVAADAARRAWEEHLAAAGSERDARCVAPLP